MALFSFNYTSGVGNKPSAATPPPTENRCRTFEHFTHLRRCLLPEAFDKAESQLLYLPFCPRLSGQKKKEARANGQRAMGVKAAGWTWVGVSHYHHYRLFSCPLIEYIDPAQNNTTVMYYIFPFISSFFLCMACSSPLLVRFGASVLLHLTCITAVENQ